MIDSAKQKGASMRTIRRYITALLASGALLGLAACGGSTPAATQPSAAAPQSTATIVATQPSATSSAAPSATSSTVVATQAAATTIAQANRPYAALPQSRTPEGYYVLGNADAPVTLTFYSDFL
jgi:protein-disulfide isomerase